MCVCVHVPKHMPGPIRGSLLLAGINGPGLPVSEMTPHQGRGYEDGWEVSVININRICPDLQLGSPRFFFSTRGLLPLKGTRHLLFSVHFSVPP